MATPITDTGDVGVISVATNANATITWYAYERPHGTGTSIFIQREVNGVFETEVRFLAEGEKPKIFFDPTQLEWILLYVLNENLWMITIDEETEPATQSSQSGTVVDNFTSKHVDSKNKFTAKTIISERSIHGSNTYSIDNTKTLEDVTVVASMTPSTTMNVRWKAKDNTISNQNENIYGFNIYARRFLDGALAKINNDPILFKGDTSEIYEHEVPKAGGQYFVTQINYKGNVTSQLIEGLIKPPSDKAFKNDIESNEDIGSSRNYGESLGAIPYNISDNAAANVIPPVDNMESLGGGGLFNSSSIINNDVVQVVSGSSQPIIEPTQQFAYGGGLRLFISGTGLGRIIVG